MIPSILLRSSSSLSSVARSATAITISRSLLSSSQPLTITPTPTPIARRTMATAPAPATATKVEWLVILPDNVGALPKRMEVRPKHLEGLTPKVESGFWKMGGAYLEEVPQEGAALKIQGSAMIALAETKEEVLEVLKSDVYSENDVWDFSKIQIYPFKCAFRKP
ncbi:hypothetical protein PVAG01_04220 [Phlyctema vagabunda]|uniref:YCII-related domain-containing protein n=1 Tax=Phlyctema vagabunda TaxID=108571 RepID=A0ABR4PNP6_9HELO